MQLALEHSDEDGGVDGIASVAWLGHADDRGPGASTGLGERSNRGATRTTSPTPTPRESPDGVATSEGVTVAVERGTFLGVQFHPEKSGTAGLTFLERCLSPV